MVKAFVMRLMHLGFESHMVGETVTSNLLKKMMSLSLVQVPWKRKVL
jgi:D-arabinose 5-phosphate isomerase GutQ